MLIIIIIWTNFIWRITHRMDQFEWGTILNWIISKIIDRFVEIKPHQNTMSPLTNCDCYSICAAKKKTVRFPSSLFAHVNWRHLSCFFPLFLYSKQPCHSTQMRSQKWSICCHTKWINTKWFQRQQFNESNIYILHMHERVQRTYHKCTHAIGGENRIYIFNWFDCEQETNTRTQSHDGTPSKKYRLRIQNILNLNDVCACCNPSSLFGSQVPSSAKWYSRLLHKVLLKLELVFNNVLLKIE